MLTQKQIKNARIKNKSSFNKSTQVSLARRVGRLNLAYLKALEQTIDTMILNKNLFQQDKFCIETKELYKFVSVDAIAIQELANNHITGVGYRTLVEEFEIQHIDFVEKSIIDYNSRSSLHTELVYIDDSKHPIGLDVTLPKRTI